MTTTDVVLLGIAAAVWAAVIWHGTQARAVGELWWSCVCLALIITLKIGVIAHWLNRHTGGVYLDELLIHLLAIVMITLTLSWLVLVRYGTRRAYRPIRLGGAAAMLVFLTVTWFLSPVYNIPDSPNWLPSDVLTSPVMALHWAVLHLYLLRFSVVFVALAWPEARVLPPGYVRLSIWLLIAAQTLFGFNNTAEAIAQIRALMTGQPEPAWLIQTVAITLIAIFALFFLAVALPLIGRGRTAAAAASTDARVASLWRWIQHASGGQSVVLGETGPTLFDQVTDIRDSIWRPQGYIGPADLAAAGRQARARGLFGVRGRADIAAACLALAAQRRLGQEGPVPPPPAKLGRLGGGKSTERDAWFLAAVADALLPRVQPAPRPST